MLCDDKYFDLIVKANLGSSPFQALAENIDPVDASTPESLYEAFLAMFRSDGAKSASNVVFIWTVDRPFTHTEGRRLESTISYIEIASGTLAARWGNGILKNIVKDSDKEGRPPSVSDLQVLADRDMNWSFYSRLIANHGPLRVWYASLDALNSTARSARLNEQPSIRAWERLLIRCYREIHGRRPLKNRQD